ncbi:MAG: hypothetical protein KDK64_03135 [Chlamydiia bacterium]|nr:hypothetical protein [Chlamydiia bacterium]
MAAVSSKCVFHDAETSDTHVSILRWLETYPAEGNDHPTFYDYCMWKLAKRVNLYITALAKLNCASPDLQGLTEARTDSLQRMMLADTTLRGLVSFRFSFNPSPWKPTHSFETFTQEIGQNGPHILFGNFPPFCYKAAPKEKLKINGKSIMGWDKGTEHIKRPFNNAVIVVGCQEAAHQSLVFYRSAIDSFSKTYVSSYQNVRETAEFLFHETYAVYLTGT